MPTIHFIFAHLLGDFVFQSGYLLKWKARSWKGFFLHGMIHFGLYLLVFFPFLLKWEAWATILLVSAIHTGIDDMKLWADRTNKRYLRNFWVDQAAHLGVLLIGGYVIAGLDVILPVNEFFELIYANYYLFVYLSLCVVVGPVVAISRYRKGLEEGKKAAFKWNFTEIFKRIAVVTVLYAILMVLGLMF